MQRIFNLLIHARERPSRLIANRRPIFGIWFENCRNQVVRDAGESGIRLFAIYSFLRLLTGFHAVVGAF
jgi:hypothetical protein